MKNDLNILVIEDVAADVVLINHELRKAGLSFRSKRIETRDDLCRELKRQPPPDLILSDHGMPQFDGFTALAIAKEKCPDVPFIFVTGSIGEEAAVETIKSGASDYVLKNRLFGLGPAVARALHRAGETHRRREAEHALRESEERFRMLAEGVRDYAIMMLSPEGNVSSWNSGAEWIFGYRHDQIVGQPLAIFFAEETEAARDIHAKAVLSTAAAKGRIERELQHRRREGSLFWAGTIVTALRDEHDGLRGFSTVTRDITERRKVEEERARLAAIVESSEDAIIGKTIDGVITSWNAGAEKLFGRPAREAVGRPALTVFFPPELAGEEQMILTRVARGERVEPFETVRVHQDGRRLDVSVSVSPVLDQDGRITGVSSIIRDITERRRAAEKLGRSEARHTAMLEAALDAIISFDQQGVIHEWNPAAKHIFVYPRADAVGRKLDDLIIPSTLLQAYRDGLANYLITGVGSLIGRPIELSARRADGMEFSAELTITAIPASDPPLYTSVIRDITARKQAEAEVRRLNAELERRVAERTAQLEAANQDLESFSYSVSHDLRAPVRHIKGFVGILRQQAGEKLGEEGRTLLHEIDHAAGRMDGLIVGLLDFARLGLAEMHRVAAPLADIVRSVRDDLAAETRPDVQWAVGDLPVVWADPMLISQVMVNLLANALKYTRQRDQPRIEIGATETPHEVVVHVRDNGAGFDMQYADKLFGVFQRLHRESDFEGTGIGLANVRRIIQRHGGRTWAEGAVGSGATFYFSLPKKPETPHA